MVTLNRPVARPGQRGTYGARLQLDGLQERQRAARGSPADCIYSRTGEGLHRSVDPADKGGPTSTHQFEVPDARRVFTTFEQPDLKAPFTFTVSAPGPLGRHLQRGHPRAHAVHG